MKKVISIKVLLWLLMGLCAMRIQPCVAQQTDFQSWSLLTATVSLDPEKKFFIYSEVQPRVGDDVSRLERLLMRPALGYNLNKNVALYLGYAWTPTFTNAHYDEDFRNENRIWQQVLIKHADFGIDWQHRIRQEQRIIEDASGPSNRTRYLLRGSYGLSEDRSFGITGYNEIFVTENSTHKGPKGGFDRDRFFAGPYIVSGPARYEVGYLGEYARRFGDGSRMINALLVSANFNF
jgi:hypothetical protein